MTSAVHDQDFDDEPTLSCRYLLFSELPSGELVVRQPACEGSPSIDELPRRWVLVKRPSEPAPPPSERPSALDQMPESEVRVRLVRPNDLPNITLDEV